MPASSDDRVGGCIDGVKSRSASTTAEARSAPRSAVLVDGAGSAPCGATAPRPLARPRTAPRPTPRSPSSLPAKPAREVTTDASCSMGPKPGTTRTARSNVKRGTSWGAGSNPKPAGIGMARDDGAGSTTSTTGACGPNTGPTARRRRNRPGETSSARGWPPPGTGVGT